MYDPDAVIMEDVYGEYIACDVNHYCENCGDEAEFWIDETPMCYECAVEMMEEILIDRGVDLEEVKLMTLYEMAFCLRIEIGRCFH